MPRMAREKSESGIYHIMLRGINKQEIFHHYEDRLRFLTVLERYKSQSKIKIHGWCLMGNHVHLLMEEGEEDISTTMKRIGVSYAWYYNLKYNYTGHLFQDRYLSEAVEKDDYLLVVVRYIHQNPVKAGIVRKLEDWQWSSYRAYNGKSEIPAGITDKELILGMFSEEEMTAIREFADYNEQGSQVLCLGQAKNKRMSDEEAILEMRKIIAGREISELQKLPKVERDEILRRVKGIAGISQRQAARILGISANMIFKA